MIYAKLTPQNTFDYQVGNANIEWDANNYCTPEALIKDGKADQFGIVPLTETPQPTFNPATQTCYQDGAELVNGAWQTKWRIDDLTPEQIEAVRKASVPEKIEALNGLLVLDAAGLSGAYEAWANSPDRTFAQKAFITKAIHWRRDDPTLAAAASELGLTDTQIDDLFIAASQL